MIHSLSHSKNVSSFSSVSRMWETSLLLSSSCLFYIFKQALSSASSIAIYGASIYVKDKATVNKIQMKLNKTMRLVTGSRMRTHVSQMMSDLGWMKFQLMMAY